MDFCTRDVLMNKEVKPTVSSDIISLLNNSIVSGWGTSVGDKAASGLITFCRSPHSLRGDALNYINIYSYILFPFISRQLPLVSQ